MSKRINEEDFKKQLQELSEKVKWDWKLIKNLGIKQPFNVRRIAPMPDLGLKYQGTSHYALAAE